MEVQKTSGRKRPLPRPFSFYWGSGQIVEEATYVGQYHEPAIQLLEYEDGSLSVRFCYYNHNGQFQRSPLTMGEQDLASLREELEGCPRLQVFLQKLLD